MIYQFNESTFYEALKKKGYRSYGELAKELGIHRNTIYHYLSGQEVLPEKFEQIISALDIPIEKALIKVSTEQNDQLQNMAPIVDELLLQQPNSCFVLFGSRARKTHHKYSDWDIGVYSKDKLTHVQYRELLKKKSELIECFPYFMDLVNLNQADQEFLSQISRDWKFLAGRSQDWLDLQKKVRHAAQR